MSPSFKLLQICNVGKITGGTAACAWTVSRCFPEFRHTVLFLSSPDAETERVWQDSEIHHAKSVTEELLEQLVPDLILFHNTHPRKCAFGELHIPSVAYLHSATNIAPADMTIACSHWLTEQRAEFAKFPVVHQSVPRPKQLKDHAARSPLSDELTIGRLCTPSNRKWPTETIDWYAELAEQHPTVNWEFVGCPDNMQPFLREAVRDRATFHPTGWSQRGLLWNWDALLYHHPSLCESFGRTVAEAMRAGCIPIVDNRGGFREQIIEGTGFLCNSLDEFSAAIAQLQQREIRWQRSRACRGHADQKFGLQCFREELTKIFAEAVG